MRQGLSLLLKQALAFVHIKVLDLRLHSASQSRTGIENRKENERIIEEIELRFERLRKERILAVEHLDTLIAMAEPTANTLQSAASESANQVADAISLQRSKAMNPLQFGIKWIRYSTAKVVELMLARTVTAASRIQIKREVPSLPDRPPAPSPAFGNSASNQTIFTTSYMTPSGSKVGVQDQKLLKRINTLSANRGPLYAFLYLALGAPVYVPIFFLKQGRGLEDVVVMVGCVVYIPLLLVALFRYSRNKRQLTLIHELETIRLGGILSSAGQMSDLNDAPRNASASEYLARIAPQETLRQPAVEKMVWLLALFGTFALRSILRMTDEYAKGAIVASFIVVSVPLLATILQYDAHRAISRIREAQSLLPLDIPPLVSVTVTKESLPLYAIAPFCGFPLLLVILGFQLEKSMSAMVSIGGPAPQTSPASSHRGTVEQRLRDLENLRTTGLITDEEYRAKRADLLSEI